MLRKAWQMLLQLEGHEVIVADNGAMALQLYEQTRPDVALLDIGIAPFDGHELAHRIRSSNGGNQVLLVAITGWGQDRDRLASQEAGFDHHFTKPVEPEVVIKLIRTWPART